MPALFTSLLEDPVTDETPSAPADVLPYTKLFGSEEFHVLTMISTVPQAGTTTLALLVASLLNTVSEREIRVAVVDMNTSSKEMFFYSTAVEPQFINISGQQPPTALDNYCLPTEHGFDEYLVFGDTHSTFTEEGKQFEKFLHLLKQNYDVVILDAGHGEEKYTKLAVDNSENMLCVIDCQNGIESQQIEKAHNFKNSNIAFGLILNRNMRSLLSTFKDTADTRKNISIVASFPSIPNMSSCWLKQASTDLSIQSAVKQLAKNTFGAKFLTKT
jgi:hypothetical protein